MIFTFLIINAIANGILVFLATLVDSDKDHSSSIKYVYSFMNSVLMTLAAVTVLVVARRDAIIATKDTVMLNHDKANHLLLKMRKLFAKAISDEKLTTQEYCKLLDAVKDEKTDYDMLL